MKEVKAYRCDFCKKYYISKHWAKVHENGCYSNPKNFRPCFNGCGYLDKKNVEINDGHFNDRLLTCFYCLKKEIFLHPPKNEAVGNHFNLGEHSNNPMPKKCEDYEHEFNFLDF